MIRIAMIGAPCTGKTTIAKKLSEGLPLSYVHEYAADSEVKSLIEDFGIDEHSLNLFMGAR